MGRRKVGWKDESVSSGFSDHKDQQYKGQKGVKDILRVVTDCEEYRVHEIDDVFKNKEGEYITFNVVCCKKWDDDAADGDGDWAGDCLACEREYDAKTKFIAGVIKVGEIKGKSAKPAKVEAHQCVYYWPFGNDKYEQIRNIVFNLEQAEDPQELKSVELLVSCGKAKDAVQFQKLDIQVYGGKKMTTREHLKEAAGTIRKLIDAASAPTKPEEMKRRLKKKKVAREEDPEDNDSEDDEEESKPAKKKPVAKGKKRRPAKKDPEPEPEDDGDDDDDEGEGTGDPEMDALMSEI